MVVSSEVMGFLPGESILPPLGADAGETDGTPASVH